MSENSNKNSEQGLPLRYFINYEEPGASTAQCHDLTKREMFAIAYMHAYVSGINSWTDGLNGGSLDIDEEYAARRAVGFADALIKELSDE